MTLSDFGNLGDFVGGIAVVITRAYLAVQIRQSTKEVRSASLDAEAASHMEFQRSIWGEPGLNKVWFEGMHGVPLPEDAGRQFLFMVITCARHWERAYHRARGGNLDSTSWPGIHKELAGVFSFPGTREYWTRVQYMFPADFVEFAEKAVREFKEERPYA